LVSRNRELDRRGREIGRVGVGELEEMSIGDSGGRAIEGIDGSSPSRVEGWAIFYRISRDSPRVVELLMLLLKD